MQEFQKGGLTLNFTRDTLGQGLNCMNFQKYMHEHKGDGGAYAPMPLGSIYAVWTVIKIWVISKHDYKVLWKSCSCVKHVLFYIEG